MEELTRLGRYELRRVLGRGAMGIVYAAWDSKLDREVALKTILPDTREGNATRASSAQRFVREAQAVARLSHPNIVTVHDFGEENGLMYLVMEYIHGVELQQVFDQNQRFSLHDASRLGQQLLDALSYAHSKGVIHRDIKPANVMLVQQEGAPAQIKLTDFGVARLQDYAGEQTQLGGMVGTPSYMAPEQIAGQTVDARSDLFAAALIFYQLLCGRRAFQGAGSWQTQLMILQQDPPLPSVFCPELTTAHDCVLLRALAKQAARRYPDAQSFKDDWLAACAGQPLLDGITQPLLARDAPFAIPAALLELQQAGQNTQTSNNSHAAEIEFWRAIQDENDSHQFALYLERYPQGLYADLARHKLQRSGSGADDGMATRVLPRTTGAAAVVAAEAAADINTVAEKPAAARPDHTLRWAGAGALVTLLIAGLFYLVPGSKQEEKAAIITNPPSPLPAPTSAPASSLSADNSTENSTAKAAPGAATASTPAASPSPKPAAHASTSASSARRKAVEQARARQQTRRAEFVDRYKEKMEDR